MKGSLHQSTHARLRYLTGRASRDSEPNDRRWPSLHCLSDFVFQLRRSQTLFSTKETPMLHFAMSALLGILFLISPAIGAPVTPQAGIKKKDSQAALTTVVRTVPQRSEFGVSVDRRTLVGFSRKLKAPTVTPQSIVVTVNNAFVPYDLSLSLNREDVIVTYPNFLPGDSVVRVQVIGSLLRDHKGRLIDGDNDGVAGGDFGFRYFTGNAVDAPVTTDHAVIIGHVFDQNNNPLAGATVDAQYWPGQDGEPGLPAPVAISDMNGLFQYTTVDFTGSERFLLRIRLDGHTESLRDVTVLATGCAMVDDAFLMPRAPAVMVTQVDGTSSMPGGVLVDPTGQVSLEIPAGALGTDSEISLTILDSSSFLRDELPPLVAELGVFVDIQGVFGEETSAPVTLRLPNTYDLPLGTRIPFGKIDHNTLEWTDLSDLYEGGTAPLISANLSGTAVKTPSGFTGEVINDGAGGTVVEVQFDHFCSICTGYCLPFFFPDLFDQSGDSGTSAPTGSAPGNSCGQSVISLREGYLGETVSLPTFTEFGEPFGISFSYYSASAAPSVTLSSRVDYMSTRPVERTVFEFNVEGVQIEAVYDRSSNNQKPYGTLFWDGHNGLGQTLPTGSYPYTIVATSLNADVRVSIPPSFGEQGVPVSTQTYPGLTPLRSEEVSGRAVLLNLQGSDYGAGWSLDNETRLYFDPDGCIVMAHGNSEWFVFEPDPALQNVWLSPTGETSNLVHNPATGEFERSFTDGSKQVFLASGRISYTDNRYGQRNSFSYTGGLLTRMESPTGYAFDFFYDAADKLEHITDSAGRTTLFQVDAFGDLAQTTDPVGGVHTFTYDAEHHLIAQAGSRGDRSEYQFINGRVVESRAYDVDGVTLLRRRQFQPSALKGEVTASFANGEGTLGVPIPLVLDRIDVAVDGRGIAARHETDSRGQTVFLQDGVGGITQFVYDDLGRMTSMQRADGSKQQREYGPSGNLVEIRELLDGVNTYASTTFEYAGSLGLPIEIIDAEGKRTSVDYDELGRVVAVRDHLQNELTVEYDDSAAPSLPTTITFEEGEQILIAYTSHGNSATITDFPNPATNPSGRSLQLTYDSAGNNIAMFDSLGNLQSFCYDELNRLTLLIDPQSIETSFSWADLGCGCSVDLISEVGFATAETVAFHYDGLNRLIERIDQRGKSQLFEYDEEGNQLQYTNRLGQLTDYEYDESGRQTRRTAPGEPVSSYSYDDRGRLLSADNTLCSLEFDYDPLGRVLAARTELNLSVAGQSFPVVHELGYSYDLVGNRLSTLGSLGVVDYTYGYDDLHRQISIADPSVSPWTMSYDRSSRRASVGWDQSGVLSTYSYDSAGQQASISHVGASSQLLSYSSFDVNGNLTALTAQGLTQPSSTNFGYDELGQLQSAQDSTFSGELALDQASIIGPANRLESDGTFLFDYDDEGRLTSRIDTGSGVTGTFEYYTNNRLSTYSESIDSGGTPLVILTTTYRYDPIGRRVEKSVNGVSTRYVYDGDEILLELDGRNRVVRSFVHGPEVDDPLGMVDHVIGEAYYYHKDRLGSVVAISNGQGLVVAEFAYGEFGTMIEQSNPAFYQPFTLTGRERDFESGLYYLRARYYDPTVGRFVSEDPIGLSGGLNMYVYVGSNPVNYTDPTGLDRRICSRPLGFLPFQSGKLRHDYVQFRDSNGDLTYRSWGQDGPIEEDVTQCTGPWTSSTDKEDSKARDLADSLNQTREYSLRRYNCQHYSRDVFNER